MEDGILELSDLSFINTWQLFVKIMRCK